MKFKDLILNIFELDLDDKKIIKEFKEKFKSNNNEKKSIKIEFNNPIVILTLYEDIVDYNLLKIDKIINFGEFELENVITKEPKIIAFELDENKYEIYPIVVDSKIIFFKKDKIKQIIKELKLEKEADIFSIQSEIILNPNKLKQIKNIENKVLIIDLVNLENFKESYQLYQIPSISF